MPFPQFVFFFLRITLEMLRPIEKLFLNVCCGAVKVGPSDSLFRHFVASMGAAMLVSALAGLIVVRRCAGCLFLFLVSSVCSRTAQMLVRKSRVSAFIWWKRVECTTILW